MNGSGITYEDVILAQNREEEEKLRKKLEAYENMRKEIKEYIEKQVICMKKGNLLIEVNVDELLYILNKVGGSDE